MRGSPSGPGVSEARDRKRRAASLAVRLFLARRAQLDARARHELAFRLEQGLREKVTGAPEQLSGERFLERLAALKTTRQI